MRGETEEGVGRVVEEGYTAHDKNVSLVPPTPDGKTPGGEDGSSIAPPATTGEKESGVERKFKVLLGANSTISLAKLRTLSWSGEEQARSEGRLERRQKHYIDFFHNKQPSTRRFSPLLTHNSAPFLHRIASLISSLISGCPPLYRGESWRLLLSYSPVNRTRRSAVLDRKRREYWKSISQVGLGEGSSTDPPPTLTKFEQQLLRQILVDLPRTSPTIPLFQSSPVQVMLKRVLYLWAVRNPACSYVQGINDLATPFVWVFLEEWVLTHLGSGVSMKSLDVEDCVPAETMREVESDTYWCLTSLLSGIQDHYTPNQPGLQRQINKLAGIGEKERGRKDGTKDGRMERGCRQPKQHTWTAYRLGIQEELFLHSVSRSLHPTNPRMSPLPRSCPSFPSQAHRR